MLRLRQQRGRAAEDVELPDFGAGQVRHGVEPQSGPRRMFRSTQWFAFSYCTSGLPLTSTTGYWQNRQR